MKRPAQTQPVAVVTGGSSGIGRATAELLASRGYLVYIWSRHGESTATLHHMTVDVCDAAAVEAAMAALKAGPGRLDLLVNSAGFGISGAAECTPIAEVERLFDVNFLGALRVIQAALPLLRESRGRIVNVSSVAAVAAIPFQGFYSAVKAALNSLTATLRNELAPFGIAVTAVMPGDVKTGFTAAREKSLAGEDLYGDIILRAVASMERDEQSGMPPEAVARRIWTAATRRRPRPFYVVGPKYRLFHVLLKFLPQGLSTRIIGLMYR